MLAFKSVYLAYADTSGEFPFNPHLFFLYRQMIKCIFNNDQSNKNRYHKTNRWARIARKKIELNVNERRKKKRCKMKSI